MTPNGSFESRKNIYTKMKRNNWSKILLVLLTAMAVAMLALTGCGKSSKQAEKEPELEDGTYVATFKSGHPMFHVNDANNDKGILTVKDGKMTIHVSLQSKKIVNLFYGTKEEAQKKGADIIEPTKDKIVYDDGYEDEVYGFDIPVPYLDKEFDVSLVGTHENWYTHHVVVSNPVPGDDVHAGEELDLEDGEHQVSLKLEGGTGKASVTSPARLVMEDGEATLSLEWSSPYYDYMIVNGRKFKPVSEEGENSVFEIPVNKLNAPIKVTADTTAMSEPHEIDYKITVTLDE